MTDTTETQEKRPGGRPSLYDPAYCEKVVELGKLGKSVEQIASHLNLSLRVMYKWRDEYEEFIFVANLHALTGTPSKEELVADTHALVLDYLAAGLDPEKVVIFKQSDVPAHTALTWIFNCLVTVPFLSQAHAYKDAVAKKVTELINNPTYVASRGTGTSTEQLLKIAEEEVTINVGTFDYPVLMATDILLYDTDVVPVGKDQTQHVEYAREIANKFNNKYETLFKEPKELVLKDMGVIPGTDGQKMSKSYGNTIALSATDEEIKKAVMSIPTDSRTPDEKKDPDELILYQIHKLFNSSAELKAQYTQGLGYGDAKKMLINDIIAFLTPMRERRAYFEKNPKLVEEILLKGAMRANDIAMKKMRKVYNAVGLIS